MHTQRNYAYIHGVRTNINNIPSPVKDANGVYIPKDFIEAATGAAVNCETRMINGVSYIDASALHSIGLKCEISDTGIVIICKKDIPVASAVIDAANELFK